MERVLVGMSGGVDSSVCTALLMKQGYEVAGATLSLHGNSAASAECVKACGSPSDVDDAREICNRLGILHYVFDFKERFSECVVNNFISEYLEGKTPNPCIECNRYIKFKAMLDSAIELGYDKVATGHYASVKQDKNGRYLLCRAKDINKDQSYVLYSLTQEQLSKIIFPLGNYLKPQVREIADKFGFVNASKPDSQDICFVPDGDYASFIERTIGRASLYGDFVDIEGKRLGEHKGIIRYTVGQRKGLGIALGKPMFVIDKSATENQVVLGDEKLLFYKRVLVDELNFIMFDKLEERMSVTAKLRYRHKEQPAVIYPIDISRVIIEFNEPQRAPSCGQSAVFYKDDVVVGGGKIVKGID